MAIYRVTAKAIGYVEAFIEAETEEQAWEYALDMDGGEFAEYDVGWEFDDKVDEIPNDELQFYGNIDIKDASE